MFQQISSITSSLLKQKLVVGRTFGNVAFQHIKLTGYKTNIATLVLNRPEKKNAFSSLTINELSTAFSEIGENKEIRGLILKASGDYFCAGADLSWMKDTAKMDKDQIKADSLTLRTMLKKCDSLRIPTLAFVKGGCIGGGVGVCSTAKTIVALPSTWFLFSEVRLGIIPAIVSPFVLKRIGNVQCKRYMMVPERIDSTNALRIGLIDKIVENEGQMDEYEMEWRKLVISGAPNAVGLVSDLIDVIDNQPPNQQEEITVNMLCERRQSTEGKEGMDCFFMKKKPSWVHYTVC